MVRPNESELPAPWIRILAFAAIIIAGGAGGVIGWSVADLAFPAVAQWVKGAVMLLAATITAGGVAVTAVLTMRSFGEWEAVQKRQNSSRHPEPGRPGESR